MGFFDWLRGKSSEKKTVGMTRTTATDLEVCELLAGGGLEYGIRKAAFFGCVNYLANILGKVEVRYFRGGQEVQGPESWRWNYEPNRNQNASAFWHQMVTRLYEDGEILIIDEPYGGNGFVVADSYTVEDSGPTTYYRGVVYRDRTRETLAESKAMRIRLNEENMAPIWEGMNNAFLKMVSTAMQNYVYNGGQHWKVAVQGLQPNDQEAIEMLQKVIQKQVMPFVNADSAVLPEFEGYTYTQLSGGSQAALNSKEVRELITELWTETAMGMGIPPVLILGKVADDKTALTRLLSGPVDAIARQLQQEANRKRLGRERVQAGEYMVFDTSNLIHYDIMENASNLQALIGSAVYSVNDVLRAIGKATINEPWADKHYLTLNIGQSPVENKPDAPAEK